MYNAYYCDDCGRDAFVKSGPTPKVCTKCGSKHVIKVRMSKNWLKNNLNGIKQVGLQVICNLQQIFPEEM